MQVLAVADPGEFLHLAGPLLLENEARHNLILGIAGTLRDHPEVYPKFHLWVVRHSGSVVGAALMTEPYNVVLADPAVDGALETLADRVRAEGLAVPGVVGNVPHAERFAIRWTGARRPIARMSQGVYALRSVREVRRASGAARPATRADRDLLVEWIRDFSREALPRQDDDRDGRMLDLRLDHDDGGMWLWEDGGAPASLAGHGGRTPNGSRIGPVYTPRELRGRGYATSLVAELSGWLLRRGRTFCFLYTDLSNPTSNAIYERIGYERVCESAEYDFEAAAP